MVVLDYPVGRKIAVGIATCYGFRWGRDFSVQTSPGAHPASFQIYTGFLVRE